uniref:Reverse transcriptase zinc-binding domain-containing protein n=1 Tax=Cannabis sativa TaxID=3483 RepID=A0A803Q8I0_CANSA
MEDLRPSSLTTGDHKSRPLLDTTQGANLVHYFINENLTWNETWIKQWFGANVAKHIINIGLPAHHQKDSWFWLGEESGVFTIKSAYHLVKKNTVINHPIWQWKVLWNTPIHARLKLLGWQILSNALLTREKLALAFPIFSNHCPICDECVESSLHLFWKCSFAKALWFGSLWGIRTDSI